MKGIEELICGIKAGYAFFYAESQEVNKTTNEIKKEIGNFIETGNSCLKQIMTWDFESRNQMGESQYNDPDGVFAMLENMNGGIDSIPAGTVVIAKNFQWFLAGNYDDFNKEKVVWLLNRSERFSAPETRKALIIIGNVPFEKAIPEVLRREFAQISFPFPGEKEIGEIYDFTIESVKGNPRFKEPDEKTRARIIAGAKGLTSSEIIKVFSYSLVKNKGVFDPTTVEELRAEEINSTPGLKIGKYDKTLEDLKGYEIAKELVEEWIDDPKAKGILLLGPAGVGKSHFGQALAGHYGRTCIEMEFAGLMGDGLVGQAEKAMKRALDVISANANPAAPIVLFIDEIEKGLAGTSGAGGSGGANDGGTTDRSNAQFLKFLSDARPDGVYIVASCNDIEKLPAAYVRAERWDSAPLFVDLPDAEQQESILQVYQEKYGVSSRPKDMTGWTGAEIKTWCKLAKKKMEVKKDPNSADELIVPINKTMSKEIGYLRTWKEGRTIPASKTKKMTEAKDEKRGINF